jgi:ribonuclease J
MRLVPLGGVGEIGRNMLVLEYAERILIIDCGVLFPEDHQPGVDVILPDFSYLDGRWDRIDGVVLTHGHEDHIGAVPYLLRNRPDIPLISSKFTLALIAAKITKPLGGGLVTVTVHDRERISVGPFDLEFLAVNHSIPEAMAVCVRTGAGTLLHTGDFKMDQVPLDGRLTDLGSIFRIGDAGLDLLLSDSTNAEVPGFVTAERQIGPVLERIIGGASGRVVLSCTSSHVHRIQQALNAAHKAGRSVAFVGRSMLRNMHVASEVGLLTVPDGLVSELSALKDVPARHQMLICTGSQGEPLSALTRMANGEHPQVTLHSEDTVILASSMIPGNESAIWRLVNELSRLGVTVVHKGNALTHTTGHAPAGELLYLINAARPKYFIPVHGEPRHLVAHAAIAESAGIPKENILILEDGFVVDLAQGSARVKGKVTAGFVFVDGLAVGDVGEVALKDRRTLRDEGVVTVVLVVESDSGKILAGPEMTSRGLSDAGIDFDTVSRQVEAAVAEATMSGSFDQISLEQVVRRTVGKWLNRDQQRRPMVLSRVLLV